MDLGAPDIKRVLKIEGLGSLHATGWLEDAAFLCPEDVAVLVLETRVRTALDTD